MDRKCEECKWESKNGGHSDYPGGCFHHRSVYAQTHKEREFGNCGPSGRYWEPREEEE